jgi:hypothetical protein
MTQTTSARSENSPSTRRPGASRKLLTRKALDKAPAALLSEPGTEASFPSADDGAIPDGEVSLNKSAADGGGQVPAAGVEVLVAREGPESGSTASPEPAQALAPADPPKWSEDDEAALQVLIARRKAAGYQKRGRDVGGQVIRAGKIKPNEGTVVSVVVKLVEERGTVTRADLVQLMGGTAFPHAKARPTDAGWCQGYIAGAIRSGYLVADDGMTPAQEA